MDHGKSSLVKLLTKQQVDRLPEEKRRLLTIELGFAHYINQRGETIGVIDVPGHERFIRNMVQGTWSLDLALLTVAGDDKWMAQTEDHSQILKAMGVPTVIPVITKADLVDNQTLQELSIDIKRRFNALFGYEIEPVVTSINNPSGIEKLKQVIDLYLGKNKNTHFAPAFFIDRSFIVDGIGTVVTGSLRQKEFNLSEEVFLLPDNVKGRIRSLQSFGKSVKKVNSGSRVALSLQGIDSELLKKGSCLTTNPNYFSNSKKGYILVSPVYKEKPVNIKNNGKYEIASCTWHDNSLLKVLATLKDERKLCYMETEEQHPWFWNQKGVVIYPGSASIAGIALFLETADLNKNKIKKIRELIDDDNSFLEKITNRNQFDLALNGYAKNADYNGNYLQLGSYSVSLTIVKEVEDKILEIIKESKLLSLEIAKNRFSYPPDLVSLIIDSMIKTQKVVLKNQFLEIPSNETKELTKQQKELLERIRKEGFSGFEVKNLSKEDKTTVGILLQNAHIIIVESSYIYLTETYLQMVSLVLKDKKIGTQFSIGEAKEYLPLSRKYMLPLLNQMSSDGYLKRIGDKREVIKLNI